MQIDHACGRVRGRPPRELEKPGQGVRGEDAIKQQRLNAGNHLSVSRGGLREKEFGKCSWMQIPSGIRISCFSGRQEEHPCFSCESFRTFVASHGIYIHKQFSRFFMPFQ